MENSSMFCLCRKPQGSRPMIGCDGCSNWFHYDCLGLTAKQVSLFPSPWYCPSCSINETARLIQTKVADEVAKASKLIRDETAKELKEMMHKEIQLHVQNMKKTKNNFNLVSESDQKTIQELQGRVRKLEEESLKFEQTLASRYHDQTEACRTKLANMVKNLQEFELQNHILREDLAQKGEHQKNIKELELIVEQNKEKYAGLYQNYLELEHQNKILREEAAQNEGLQKKIEELESIVQESKVKYADLNKNYQELKKRQRGKLSLSGRNSQ